ncbi:MAG: MATE family efflux transporter [Phycisphaerae bacterium]
MTSTQANSQPPPLPGQEALPRFGRDLTTGSIPRHLVAFSLPMLAGSALQTAYAFVNMIWVGQFLGKSAVAAITVCFPVIFVLIAVGAGLTLAANILVAQHWGAKDLPAVRRVVDSSCILIGTLSLLVTALGIIFTPAILGCMNTAPDVLPLASHYLRIFLISLPVAFGLFLVRAFLQGIGDSTTLLYFQAGGVLLTAALDPVLMFGWLGLPALGLNGTAWAAVISNCLALVALVAYLRRRKNPVAPSMNPRRFDWRTALTTVRVGVPSAVQQSLVSVGMVFVISIVNRFGENTTAGFGLATRIDQLAFMPAMTFSMAIAAMAGQNIGAGRSYRIRAVFGWGCALSGGCTLAVSALVVCIPYILLRIFSSDPALIEIGSGYLRIVGACYIFFAIMFVSNGIINGAGHTMVTTIITLVSLWVVRVPVADWLSRRLGSASGVWYAMALSFWVSMLSSLGYYLSGRWKKAVIRRRIPETPATPEAMFGEETAEV